MTEKALVKLITCLGGAGLVVRPATSPAGLYVILPASEPPKDGACTRPEQCEATGVVWLNGRVWEAHRACPEPRRTILREKLKRVLPSTWSEYEPPTFADIVEEPGKVLGLLGPVRRHQK